MNSAGTGPPNVDFGAQDPQPDALLDELRSFGIQPAAFVRQPSQPPGFEVVRELSRGGQGVVYEAVQRSTGRRVALKVGLGRELPGRPENERFRREVRLLASLHHPSLPTVFESGIEDGWRWLAMEFIEGDDLATWVKRCGSSPRGIVELCARVCDGVALAHRHGIVHRDLKPSNILIDGEGKPVVLDFGLAKRVVAATDDPDVTGVGSIVGSPLWLAPEQIESPDEVGPRADVYALGRLLYQLLSGAHPYPGDPRTRAWLHNVRDREPLPLRSVAGFAGDPVLEAIVMRAIEREPARRYPDADALRADCVAWLEGRETLARPNGPLARVRRAARLRPQLAIAAASTAAALASMAIGWWLSAPSRWEQEVHEAIQLPGSAALSKLWELHLSAPSGVERPTALFMPESLTGPAPTHYALLAHYLAEPCLGRVPLPGPENAVRNLLTAPHGNVVVLEVAEEGGAGFWIGREPDYDWVRLPALAPATNWVLSEDGRYLAGRAAGPDWRLWELAGDAGAGSVRELDWAREQTPSLLALYWSEVGTPGTIALTRGTDDELRLVRLEDGVELAHLPGLTAALPASASLRDVSLSPGGKWLAVAVANMDPWLVALEDPSAPPRRLPQTRARWFEFVDSTNLAIDLGALDPDHPMMDLNGLWLVDVEREDAALGQFLFATSNRPRPTWLREHAFVARSTTSRIELLSRGATEPVLRWSTPASVLQLSTLMDRRILVTWDSDGYLSRWNVAQDSGETIVPPWHRLFPESGEEREDGSVHGIAFSPSSERVAVSVLDPPRVRVRTLRGNAGELELALPEGDRTNCLAWSRADDGLIAIGGLSGRIYLWSVDSPASSGGGSELSLLPTPAERPAALVPYGELGGSAHAVAFSPDGRYLLAAGQTKEAGDPGRMRAWRVGEPGVAVRTLEHPSLNRVTSLAFGGGGQWLVAGTAKSNRLQWLDGPLPEELAPLPDFQPDKEQVTRDIGVHGSGVFSVHRDGTVRHRERGADEGAEFDLGSEPFSVAVHPDGSLVAAGTADGWVHLLTFVDRRFSLVASIPFPALRSRAGTRRLFRVLFSPDGQYLVAGGESGTVPCYLDLREAERCLAGNLDWALAQQR